MNQPPRGLQLDLNSSCIVWLINQVQKLLLGAEAQTTKLQQIIRPCFTIQGNWYSLTFVSRFEGKIRVNICLELDIGLCSKQYTPNINEVCLTKHKQPFLKFYDGTLTALVAVPYPCSVQYIHYMNTITLFQFISTLQSCSVGQLLCCLMAKLNY